MLLSNQYEQAFHAGNFFIFFDINFHSLIVLLLFSDAFAAVAAVFKI
jgi:hypothetical protein